MSVIHRVVCRTCGAVFTGHSVSQADGCAAHYARGVVYGHYGSKYDISAIRVPLANITPELLAQTDNGVLDPVCDDCIDVWIAAGSFAQVARGINGIAFGPHGILRDIKLEPMFSGMELIVAVEYIGPNPEGMPFEASALGTSRRA